MLKRLAVVAVVFTLLPLLFPAGAEAQGLAGAARLAAKALVRASPQQIARVAEVLPLGRSLTPAEVIRRLEADESFLDQFLSEAVQRDPVNLRALLATSGEMTAEDALRFIYLQSDAPAYDQSALVADLARLRAHVRDAPWGFSRPTLRDDTPRVSFPSYQEKVRPEDFRKRFEKLKASGCKLTEVCLASGGSLVSADCQGVAIGVSTTGDISVGAAGVSLSVPLSNLAGP